MLKKLPILCIIAILLVSLFTATAFAAPNSFTGYLNKANAQIESLINQAVADANAANANLNYNIYTTNVLVQQDKISQKEADGRIRNYQADFENQVKAIASRLIADTDRVVVAVVQEANRQGIEVSVTYVVVDLAGYIYLIDPLRIVGN